MTEQNEWRFPAKVVLCVFSTSHLLPGDSFLQVDYLCVAAVVAIQADGKMVSFFLLIKVMCTELETADGKVISILLIKFCAQELREGVSNSGGYE